MEEDQTVEAALLKQYSDSIEAMLKNPRMSKSDRMILEAQRLFVILMRGYHEDRIKVSIMWRTYAIGNRLLWLLLPMVVGDLFLRVYGLIFPK